MFACETKLITSVSVFTSSSLLIVLIQLITGMEGGKNFQISETKYLVKLFCDSDWQKKFENHKKSQKHVWQELSAELEQQNGIQRTGEQCQNKIKNLKKEFFKLKRSPSGSGQIEWPYYEDFAKVFGGSALLNPVMVIDSLESSESDVTSQDESEYSLSLVSEDDTDPLFQPEAYTDRPSTSASTINLDRAKLNSSKRKNAAAQINEYLRKTEETDKRDQAEKKKMDNDLLLEMKKMNENMADLIALKRQKLEQPPMFQLPYFQPPSPNPPNPKTASTRKSSH